MSGHTQGNWIAVGDWVELDDDTRADICSVNPRDFDQGSFGRSDDEMRANARLIAAAPAMLEALFAADLAFAEHGILSSHATRIQIRAAIKAAKGQS